MQAKLKQAEESTKQQQSRMANAIRMYGRKRGSSTGRVSDVDVDLARYAFSELNAVRSDQINTEQ